jgi:hypothetical protein
MTDMPSPTDKTKGKKKTDANAWRVRAAAYRRMAATAKEAERERKLLMLASDYEERAAAIEVAIHLSRSGNNASGS